MVIPCTAVMTTPVVPERLVLLLHLHQLLYEAGVAIDPPITLGLPTDYRNRRRGHRNERHQHPPVTHPPAKKRSYRIKAVNIFDDDNSSHEGNDDSMTISSSSDSMSMSTHSMLSQSSSRKQPSSYSPKTGMKRSYRIKSVSPIDSPPLF